MGNDSTPNFLYLNKGNGTFEDASYASGFALNDDGREIASMGIAAGDYENNGLIDFFVTVFGDDYKVLYHNDGKAMFSDISYKAGVAQLTIPFVGWGDGFIDYDNDGWLDLFVTYFGRNVLYRNRGGVRFEDVTRSAGLEASDPRWGSGCSFLDYDRDGDLDLFVANYLKFDLASASEPGQGANCVWKGIAVNCGPKGLPTDVTRKLVDALDKALEDETVKKRLLDLGTVLPNKADRAPDGLAAIVKRDVELLTPILKASGAIGQ